MNATVLRDARQRVGGSRRVFTARSGGRHGLASMTIAHSSS